MPISMGMDKEKLDHIHDGIFVSHKESRIQSCIFAKKCTEVKTVMLGEISQTQNQVQKLDLSHTESPSLNVCVCVCVETRKDIVRCGEGKIIKGGRRRIINIRKVDCQLGEGLRSHLR